MKIFYTFILILKISTIISHKIPIREHSLSSPYIISGDWDYGKNVIITPNSITLTQNLPSQSGIIWNTKPCSESHWEIHLELKITGDSGTLFGDGLALWYLDKFPVNGPVFGSHDFFRGLAVFIDTYSNHNGPHHHQHPYISAMVNNGSTHYDHDTDGTHTQLAGCSAPHLRNNPLSTSLVVRYVDRKLTVATRIGLDESQETPCFSVADVYLPEDYYFAVSAATGGLFDKHEVISIKTYQLDSDQAPGPLVQFPSAPKSEPERTHTADESAPRRWTDKSTIVLLLMVLGAVGTAGFYGHRYWRRSLERSKRFY